jgi:hypothetical protein
VPGLLRESSSLHGPRAAEAGSGGGPDRPRSARASLPSSPGLGPSQSGRRWGTDWPAASTSRSSGARGPGPADSDYATAGAAGRAPRTAGAGRGRTRIVERFVT